VTKRKNGALASEVNPEAQSGILHVLGPGLITGAADDDPSGIATYSQVGAQFGFGMLWTTWFSFPLMSAIQEICARLGRVTGVGIAANLRKRYPRVVVYSLVALLCVANIFNLGADISAMGAAGHIATHVNSTFCSLAFGLVSLLLQVFIPYRRYVKYLRWLSVALFAYLAAPFALQIPWLTVLRASFIPRLSLASAEWMALVAVLGTTISPYLFFWQTSQEAEDVRLHPKEEPLKKKPRQAWEQFRRITMDTRVGMALSNVVAFAIILTAASTLHGSTADASTITASDAARALEPVLGRFAEMVFALGIIGTGLLAIPVLAGSAAYAVTDTFGWKATLESKFSGAPRFYGVIIVATIVGTLLALIGLQPIRALYWSAILNGIAAVPIMYVLMRVSGDSKVVGKFQLPVYLRVVGWVATTVMLVASIVFLASTLTFGRR
jgi:NRAMP (natural resistance-associated macrophage protein)-like metal ion transporter